MDFPTVRELSRRKNAVRVLKFLMKCEEPLNFTDVYTTLDANDCTILYWLKRLVKFGILNGVRSIVNLHSTYYSIGDKEGVERIIERYHWRVGFKLARLVSYRKTSVEQLRKDKRFIALCDYHYLTLGEGIKAVMNCAKVSIEKGHNITYLYRKSQGYDEPKIDIFEEAKRAIE